jgi:hypothetical protein
MATFSAPALARCDASPGFADELIRQAAEPPNTIYVGVLALCSDLLALLGSHPLPLAKILQYPLPPVGG